MFQCWTCGKTFEPWPASKRKGVARYCSVSCRAKMKVPLIDRIIAGAGKKEASGCIPWTLRLDEWGYGTLCDGKKTHLAHRVSFACFVGEIPRGMLVLHRCDNPKCINPVHLFLGTHRDNAIDREQKLRGRYSKKRRIQP